MGDLSETGSRLQCTDHSLCTGEVAAGAVTWKWPAMSDEKSVPVDPVAAAEAADGHEIEDESKLKSREAAEQDSALGKLTDRVSLQQEIQSLQCVERVRHSST